MVLSLAHARHRMAVSRDLAALRRIGGTAADEASGRATAPRPSGPLIWVHCAPGIQADALARIIEPPMASDSDLAVLLTGAVGLLPGCLYQGAPLDSAAVARRFLDHWRPDVAVWIGPQAHPVTWAEALRRDIPCLALNADPALLALALARPLTDFILVLATRSDARLGARIETLGALADVPPPPRVREPDREALSSLLATRPVWLCAGLPVAEVQSVLQAHRVASKLSHRLLLIAELADPSLGPALRTRLEAQGWRCALRSAHEDPVDVTQVLIADLPGETGLWLRLAPITYLGGTLVGGDVPCSPWGPAALGSVVLHGGAVGSAGPALARLHAAGAAWRIGDADEMGRAVERFQAPERAAEMASSGWDVTTAGALATDRAVQVLLRLLEPRD